MSSKLLALSGGIGGAKLALGLSHVIASDDLTIVANIGDDFEHLGLTICPDLDTLLYTLSNLANPQTGWGRREESWNVMATLRSLGGPDWFQLGDHDLALHLERSRRLAAGELLSAIMHDVAMRLGLSVRLLPASDDLVRTRLDTDVGWLDFQEYFVARRCAPRVHALDYVGADSAAPQPRMMELLADPALAGVIICPSNPFLSIDPMLAMPELRAALRRCAAPVVAVSPIIAGQAIKGPTAKMMVELGLQPDAATVANHYSDFVDLFVLDSNDEYAAPSLPMRGLITNTLMTTLDDKIALARTILAAL
jgi:LPPG:FO 2-phospho-L-lactate transferase